MAKIEVDIKKYQEEHDRYIVIKDFNKIGSAVMGYTKETSTKFRNLLSRCDWIAKSPIQVVLVAGPNALNIYYEYAPFFVYDDEQDLIDICLTGNCPGYTVEEIIELGNQGIDVI